MSAYYNEIDPYAAQWLRNLIAAGHIAPGEVDERSISDVKPDDLRPFTQCHFFAGLGGWSAALRRAGWADDRRVWTASCPCQPFSQAGAGAGMADERHLWPDFYWLAMQLGPGEIFGEQVASKDAEPWLDLVQTDLEALGYAFGAVAFPSAGIGAPHIRDRTYWVGHASGQGLGERFGDTGISSGACGANTGQTVERTSLYAGGLADSGNERRDGRSLRLRTETRGEATNLSEIRRGCGSLFAAEYPADTSNVGSLYASPPAGPVNGLWANADWLFCRDGKWRPVEPGTFPLADGAPARVGRLRAYGNAINVEAAAQFIAAYMEVAS